MSKESLFKLFLALYAVNPAKRDFVIKNLIVLYYGRDINLTKTFLNTSKNYTATGAKILVYLMYHENFGIHTKRHK